MIKHQYLYLFIFSNIVYANKPVFDHSVIEQKSHIIESQMKKDRYCMYALNVCGLVREMYRWLPLIKNILDIRNAVPNGEEKHTIKEAFKSSLSYLFYTKEGWNDIIGSLSSMMGMVIVTRLTEQLSHPDTLRWYTYNHALIPQTLSLMQKEVIKLHNAILSAEQVQALLDRLNILYDQLIEQEKLFLGYMVYKNRYLDPENKKLVGRLIQDIERKHSAWLADIKIALSSSDNDYAELDSLIKAYREDIQSDIYHYVA